MKLLEYLNNYSKKYIIFDLDETLLTLQIDWGKCRENLFKLVKSSEPNLDLHYVNEAGAASRLRNELAAKGQVELVKKYDAYWTHWEIEHYSGSRENAELVKFMRERNMAYQMNLWSSNGRETVEKALIEHGLRSLFKFIITREDVENTKPYPDGFYLIYDKMGGNLEDYVLVGNNDQDQKAAKTAGIDFLKVEPY